MNALIYLIAELWCGMVELGRDPLFQAAGFTALFMHYFLGMI